MASDEVRVTSETGGQKGRKRAQLGAIDPTALRVVAEVAGYGTEKYARYNFLRGYDWSLSYDALQRHLMAFWSGEDNDPESGLPHLGHAAWHCLALLAFTQRSVGTDDRPKDPDPVLDPQRAAALFDAMIGLQSARCFAMKANEGCYQPLGHKGLHSNSYGEWRT